MMKKYYLLAKFMVIITTILIAVLSVVYYIGFAPVNGSKTPVNIIVKKTSTYNSLAEKLKDNNLIKSVFFYKAYIKVFKPNVLLTGSYELKGNMNLFEIIKNLSSKGATNTTNVTFVEGLPMWRLVELIADKTNNSKDDVYTKLEDSVYIDSLINKYWFLTDEIKSDDIYYPLEGYLFPDTYQFLIDSDVSVILEKMLDNTKSKLEPLKEDILNSAYSIHELITLASIVENEAKTASDRAGVAGVIYNRLNANMRVDSDVTTYYSLKLNMYERDLTKIELDTYNPYNTRAVDLRMRGSLPVGPVSNPSLTAIRAAIYPTDHKYYYFVADKTGKTYFSTTNDAHNETIARLKKEGLWFTY